jgi:hypothetical protein
MTELGALAGGLAEGRGMGTAAVLVGLWPAALFELDVDMDTGAP